MIASGFTSRASRSPSSPRVATTPAGRDDAAEAPLARQLELDLREVRVVLDDQHDAVAFLDQRPVVGHRDRRDRQSILEVIRRHQQRTRRDVVGVRRLGRLRREIEDERRAFARDRANVDLAAEQAGDLA
jgi:hypothetical protein